MRWEYYGITCSHIGSDSSFLMERTINRIGREGWELVSVCRHGDHSEFYFKRPIPSPPEENQ